MIFSLFNLEGIPQEVKIGRGGLAQLGERLPCKQEVRAYVLDVDNVLYKNLNKAMISIEKVDNKYDKKELRDLIEAHVEATGSEIGKKVLADFDSYLPHFKKLIPDEYKRMITLSAKLEEKGLTSQQAQMEAFYESIGVKH